MFHSLIDRPTRAGLFLTSLFLLSPAVFAEEQNVQTQNSVLGSTMGKALNPDLAVDGLFALSQFNQDTPLVFTGGHDPKVNGFNIQQVELTFGAAIDPYFRGDVNLVLTPDGGIEIEEAYATTTDFPANLQFKGGQFLTAFGRNNPTHPHTWDFANKPLVLGRYFGGDGLRNPGAQMSWLTPLPWYSEVIVSAQNSTGGTVPSFRPDTPVDYTTPTVTAPTTATMRSPVDYLTLVRLNNFFSLSEELAMNAGASYLNGPNLTGPSTRTRIYGGDLYFKFRNPESLSFIGLTIEGLGRSFDAPGGTQTDWGWYAQLDYRLAEPMDRWHVGLRYDFVGATSVNLPVNPSTLPDTSARYRISPVVTFYPSEFSKVRFQYDYDKPDNYAQAQQVGTVQLEFLMGAHGAHKF